MKKIFSSLLLVFLFLNNLVVYSTENLKEEYLYYLDTNQNKKIDTLEITFNKEITGNPDKTKLRIYSNTGGLASYKIDGYDIIDSVYISGNILIIKIFEQDLENTNLTINNGTSSHLRIRNNSGFGIFGVDGSSFTNFSYTTSFNNYKNVLYKEILNTEKETKKENQDNNQNTQDNNKNNNSDNNIENIKDNLKEPDEDKNNEKSFLNQINNQVTNSFSGQVKIVFQNPTYLLEKELEKEVYNCDTSKTDCKVNFNLNIDEGNGIKSISTIKYDCIWDFGFIGVEEEQNKCNPNTITYPEGVFETTFKVIEKSNPNNYFERKIKIINTGFQEKIIQTKTIYIGSNNSSNSTANTSSAQNSSIYIETPKIIIQSGLDEKNNCKKNDCNLNLNYEIKNSKESCLWSFPGGIYNEGDEKKCNPGYIKYPFGDFKITLKVYETGNESNFKESYLYISNKPKNENIKQDIKAQEKVENKTSGNNLGPIAIIKLQGTIGKDKELSGKYLYCLKESCSVNFDGRESYSLDGKELKYFWDFGNGETFSGNNPPSITLNSGKYNVKLKVIQDDGLISEDNFFVIVGQKKEENNIKEEHKILNKNFSLKLTKISPNPTGVDNIEWIEITNFGTEKVNLNGCEIDDEIKKASKPYKIDYDLFLEPKKSKKFYKFDTNINLKNTGGEQVNLICFGNLVDNITWNFDTPNGFIITPEILLIKSGEVFIESIIDGDTFVLQFENGFKKIVRHIGIDTPEIKHPKKEIEKYGSEALNFAKNYFKGKKVYFILDSKNFIDNYSRILGYLSLDNKKTYGEDILSAGLAKVYDKKDFDLTQTYKNAEKEAKQKRLGIWGSYEIDFTKENLKEKKFDIKDLEIDKELKKELLLSNEKIDVIKDLLNDYKDNLSENKEESKQQKELLKEKINDVINKTFSQKISKQKKGVKIYGQTLPNVEIIFQIKKLKEDEFSFLNLFFKKTFASDIKYFQTNSCDIGKYEIFITDLDIGEFEVLTNIKHEKEIFEIFKRNVFDIDQDYIDYINTTTKSEKQLKNEIKEDSFVYPKAIIKIQGRIAKTSLLLENKIICKDVKECSVNFDGRDSIGGKNLKYLWDFGDGKISTKANPASHKFKEGKHIISLKVSNKNFSDIAYFVVEVIPKQKLEKTTVNKQKNTKNTDGNDYTSTDLVSFGNDFKNKDLKIHILYSNLLFGLFLILSFLILRSKEII